MHRVNAASWSRDSAQDFLSFANAVLPHSYSQRLQDLWALWESGFARSGYFVEFGALNGRDFSNTFLLEQLGWQGAVAEPHPDYRELVHKNRKCTVSTKCVFSESGKVVSFHAVKGRPALSTIGNFGDEDSRSALRGDFVVHEVQTVSLHDLLVEATAPRTIDFLSIDTEGSELEILGAFNFGAWNIKALCVEHNDSQRQELYELLTSNGFVRKWEHISGHDDWYVNAGIPPIDGDVDDLLDAVRMVPTFDLKLGERTALVNKLRA